MKQRMIKATWFDDNKTFALFQTMEQAVDWLNFLLLVNRTNPQDYYIDFITGWMKTRDDGIRIAVLEFIDIEVK